MCIIVIQHLCTLPCAFHNKPSNHLSLCIVIVLFIINNYICYAVHYIPITYTEEVVLLPPLLLFCPFLYPLTHKASIPKFSSFSKMTGLLEI